MDTVEVGKLHHTTWMGREHQLMAMNVVSNKVLLVECLAL